MEEVNQWKTSLKIKKKSPNTIKAYLSNISQFIEWVKKNKKVNEVDVKIIKRLKLRDLEQFMEYLMIKGNGESTRGRKTSAIKEFFRYLKKNKLIKENITDDLECPKIPKRERNYIVEQDIIKLKHRVQGCHRIRDLAIIMLLWNTGIRLSELTNLNIKDIKDNSIRIIRKGDNEAYLPLNKEAIEYLNEWLEVRSKLKYSNEKALFIGERINKDGDHRLTQNGIQKMSEANLKLVEREDCSVHSFRHGFATKLLKLGVDLRKIQELLGHSDISTTATYLHINDTELRDAVDLMAS